MQNCINRCTGHCCEDFVIHELTIEDLKGIYVTHLRGGDGFIDSKGREWQVQKFELKELTLIVNMIIPLGLQYKDPNGNVLKEPRYSYTCKFFDKVSRNCTIYQNRPNMCRNFPKHNECEYKGCTHISKVDNLLKKMETVDLKTKLSEV